MIHMKGSSMFTDRRSQQVEDLSSKQHIASSRLDIQEHAE